MSTVTIQASTPIYFASDLHLSEQTTKTQALFTQWITECRDSTIFLIGDIFDAWIGDDILHLSPPWLVALCNTLKQASAHNKIYIMHGNRDFLLGHQFEALTGVKLLPESVLLNTAQQNYLVCHGDHLCTDDHDYMAFRQQSRHPAWQAQLLQLPIPERIKLAQSLRQTSEDKKKITAYDIMDVNMDTVVQYLKTHHVHHLIHGHTHRPGYYPTEHQGYEIKRWVLTDWELEAPPMRAGYLMISDTEVKAYSLVHPH